jgi:hypothetical protein
MMRGRAPEDMTAEEQDDLRYDAMTRNPYSRCTCRNWNNDYGICSYCEWEENRPDDEQE